MAAVTTAKHTKKRRTGKGREQYKGDNEVGNRSRMKPSDYRWWATPVAEAENEVANDIYDDVQARVWSHSAAISERTAGARRAFLYYASMYDDREFLSLAPGAFELHDFVPSTLCFNVVRQCVDTLTAKIAKNRPLPKAVTNGGEFKQQRRARKLSKFFDGQFDASSVWKTLPMLVRDAALFGTGIAHNYRVGSKIIHERILPWELRVDPRDAQYGTPRTIILRRWIDRQVVLDRFPEHAEWIEQGLGKSDWEEGGYDDYGTSLNDDMVLVLEAWHLKSGEDADDGRHTIVVHGKTLVYESYERDYFPFTVLRYTQSICGFFGTGLAQQLTGIQFEINSVAQKVQESHYLMGGGVVFIDNNSDVEFDRLSNGVGIAVRYTNTKPEWHNPQPVHPDTYNFMLSLIPKSFEMTGISQLSAQSKNPLGASASGAALAEYNDIETERFIVFGRAVEDACIDTAWQFFDLAEEIQEDEESYTVRASTRNRGQHVLEQVKYSDVRMDRESFTLRVFPTSLLSQTPALRRQEITELASAGWVNRDEALALLDLPDTEKFLSLSRAAQETVDEIVERILDADDPEAPDVYVYPEPAFNLLLCLKRGVQAYLDARLANAPAENLSVLAQWLDDVRQEISKAAGGQGPGNGATVTEAAPVTAATPEQPATMPAPVAA